MYRLVYTATRYVVQHHTCNLECVCMEYDHIRFPVVTGYHEVVCCFTAGNRQTLCTLILNIAIQVSYMNSV